MTRTTDFIAELIRAANTIDDVTPFERKRLMERGMATVKALEELMELNGKVISIRSGILRDVEQLISQAHMEQTPEVILGAALLALAEEIRRLRVLAKGGHDGW